MTEQEKKKEEDRRKRANSTCRLTCKMTEPRAQMASIQYLDHYHHYYSII